MEHVVKFVVSIIVVVFIAAFYALLNIDLNHYKEDIETATFDATGRQLELAGDVSIAWSLIPTLVIEKARFSNAEWGSAAEMLSLGKFEVRLALYPLLKREIQITKILLQSPDILIETNNKGVGNWEFDLKPQEKEPDAESDQPSLVQSVIVHELDIEDAKIHYIDGVSGEKKQFVIERLSVDVADLENPFEIILKSMLDGIPVSLDGQLGGINALVNDTAALVALTLKAGGVDLALNGEIAKPQQGKGAVLTLDLKTRDSALATLLGSEMPAFGDLAVKGNIATDLTSDKATLDLVAVMNGLNLVLKGNMAKPQEARGVVLDVDLTTNSTTLALLTGSEIPPLGDIALQGNVRNGLKTDALTLDLSVLADGLNVNINGHVLQPKEADGIALKLNVATQAATLAIMTASEVPPIGEVTLSGDLSGGAKGYQLKNFKLNAGKTDLKGNVEVSLAKEKPSITATLTSDKIDLTVLEQGEDKPETAPTSDRLFSDEPLMLGILKQLNAKVTVKVEEIHSAGIRLDHLNIGVDLQNGLLQVSPLDVGFAGSKLKGHLDLNAQKEAVSLRTKMQVNGFKLAEIEALKDAISGGNTDFFLQAKGTGSSVRQLMAGLNGKAMIKTGESQIADGTLALLGADFFAELFRMINPFAKEKTGTQLACSVINFTIQDGIATARKGIAVQTGNLNIVGDGTINLKNEKIQISIKPEARTGIGINMSQLAGLVKVGGTLAKPAAKVDTSAVLSAGASGAAALATGGASVLVEGLLNRATADVSPCVTALGEQ